MWKRKRVSPKSSTNPHLNEQEDWFNIEPTSTQTNEQTVKEPVKKKKKSFKRKLFTILGITLVPMFIGLVVVGSQEQKIEAEKEAQVQKDKQEPHSRMGWYLGNGNASEKTEATAKLIAHILDTGCSKAYTELAEFYDQDSLIYIQDYLVGKSCTEYVSSAVVQIELTDEYGRYLYRTTDKRNKYIIQIYFFPDPNYQATNEMPEVPVILGSFRIYPYEEQNLIDK